MKKIFLIALICILMIFSGCSLENAKNEESGYEIIDSSGSASYLPKNAKVVSCYGSFAECWLLSGGSLAGVTDDAIKERGLTLGEDTKIIGTVKEINIENLINLEPDYVILSSDIATHNQVSNKLNEMGIQNGRFNIDSFDDYDSMMKQFCAYNNRNDLYEENVVSIQNNISDILSKVPKDKDRTYLLMRAYSTGIKVKTNNIADDIIGEFATNITEKNPSLLEDLSVEEIIKENPDYIFVLTMGSEITAKEYLNKNIESNPAWTGLDAVKSGNYIMLPKDLFHYKPNNRWDKSYEYIAKIIYPEIYN